MTCLKKQESFPFPPFQVFIPFPSIPSVYLNLESVKGAGSNLIHILIYLAEY